MGSVVKVTRDNFEALLPEIQAAIDASDFVTIDTELTGLSTSKLTQYNLLDTPQDRYSKVRDSAMNFGLLQYGLATFTYDEQGEKYHSKSWSFYLWPKVGTSADNNRSMIVQLSAFDFLSKCNFDFNLTFSKGLPYLSRTDELYKRGLIEKHHEAENGGDERSEIDISKLNDGDKKFINDQIQGLSEHVSKGLHTEPYELTPCNAFLRRLLIQQVPKHLATAVEGKIPLLVKTSKDRIAGFTVSFVTPEEYEAHVNQNYHVSLEALQQEVGFRRVIEHAISAGKPIIGHNCFMDFCHTYQKFFTTLPESYEEFKTSFNGIIPLIFDTKYFAASLQDMHGAESTSLGDMYHFLASHPIAKYASVLGMEAEEGEKFHDAGFDAFCTGQVFLGLCSLVAQRDGKSIRQCALDIIQSRPPYDLANRLFMMQSDSDGMNLAGPEDAPDRSAICQLSGFDSAIKTSHIQTALSTAGFKVEARSIIWADDESLFVRLASQEEAEKLAKMKHLTMPIGKKAMIITYERFAAQSLPSKRRLSVSK